MAAQDPTFADLAADVPMLRSLRELEEFVQRPDRSDSSDETDLLLFVRWSPDPQRDLDTGSSIDELTGIDLPGLSANGLAVEPWWEDRPLLLWVARRLYDYRHLAKMRGPGTRPWIMSGREVGRGPDNEPLIEARAILAQIGLAAVAEANDHIDRMPGRWGSLRRL